MTTSSKVYEIFRIHFVRNKIVTIQRQPRDSSRFIANIPFTPPALFNFDITERILTQRVNPHSPGGGGLFSPQSISITEGCKDIVSDPEWIL